MYAERLDQQISGILTTVCNHSFHSACISKWTDSSCPVSSRAAHITRVLVEGNIWPESCFLTTIFRSLGWYVTVFVQVCRYCQQQSENSTCFICGTSENLWICVICGFVGCGRCVSFSPCLPWFFLYHFCPTSMDYNNNIAFMIWYRAPMLIRHLVFSSIPISRLVLCCKCHSLNP